ncbi:MAG TPA: N-acetyltransferase [Desulfobacterales bacterium]|nr:N-acetyltransferase [Desulfobacterales bacterium]
MIRDARVPDVRAIYELLNKFSDKGQLLGRSLNSLYDNLRDFKVWEAPDGSGLLGAVAALHVCWGELAEIRSLAVAEAYQGQGLGRRLVQSCLSEVGILGIERVFALTYEPDFFIKMGFELIPRDELPHKVWSECLQCPKYPDCNETALIWRSDGKGQHS